MQVLVAHHLPNAQLADNIDPAQIEGPFIEGSLRKDALLYRQSAHAALHDGPHILCVALARLLAAGNRVALLCVGAGYHHGFRKTEHLPHELLVNRTHWLLLRPSVYARPMHSRAFPRLGVCTTLNTFQDSENFGNRRESIPLFSSAKTQHFVQII